MNNPILEQLQIDASHPLNPPELYKDDILEFGKVNYFIGKNGTGKSQVLTHIYNDVRNTRNQLINNDKGLVIKYLPSNRTHNIQGGRQMHSENLDSFESGNPTVDTFFQFLNGSPFTKTLVEHSLNMFFNKFPRISLQGLNILMNIEESWRKKELRKIELKKMIKGGAMGLESAGYTEKEVETIEKRVHNLQNESDGLKEMLILLTFIYHPRVKALIIDEIETHLHPHMINFISDTIHEIASNSDKQFFIITHSPTAIRLVPSSDWRYFFFQRNKDESKSHISKFSFTDPAERSLIPYLNPYKREAFYSDTIILVEGMDDFAVFQALASAMNYGEYLGGGFSFFPCWGGDNLEQYHNFFKKLGKEVYVVADNNILTRDALSRSFKENFRKYPKQYRRLSKNDITEFCVNENGHTEKNAIIEDEIRMLNEGTRAVTDYVELTEIIKQFIGTNPRLQMNWEFIKLAKDLAHQIQIRFNDLPEWKDLLSEKSQEKLVEAIESDPELTLLWQDSVKSEFKFIFGTPWKCKFVYKSGLVHYALEFKESDNPAKLKLKRL